MDWRSSRCLVCGCLLLAAAGRAQAQAAAGPIGLFSDHTDVGTVLHPGSVVYDAARHSYTISGSGENVWAAADAFQFVWKKMEGDFTLTADISVLGQGGDPHKKAMLMARQSLDADSAYADVALHGVGLTSLQARDAKGADTHEVQSNISAPKRLRLQKYGDEFTMWLAGEDGKFRFAGGSMRVPLTGAFYVGLGVCAHNKDVVETAEFGDAVLESVAMTNALPDSFATLETITVASTDRRVTYVASGGIAAPTWTPDGASLLFTHEGRIERVLVSGGEPKAVDTGKGQVTVRHGISPDGTMLAFDGETFGGDYATWVMPISGGAPRRIAAQSSTWCGWSPDGKTIVFIGYRRREFGIYTIPAAGGEETRLAATTYVSGMGSAEYSPDGKYIYFNSDRSGAMEIWRMRPDGSAPEQVTKDGAGNWFPHVSPDGRMLAFLTPRQIDSQFPLYLAPDGRTLDFLIPQQIDSQFPLSLAPVTLRVMTLADRQVRVLAKLIASGGSMPAPSWSPDSRRLAFVSYQGFRIDTERPLMFVPKKIVK